MTALRDQLADHNAIRLHRHQDIGALLRHLRTNAGYTLNRFAANVHISRSGLLKREVRGGMTIAALIDHAHALGYSVALIPDQRTQQRDTGTGWPAEPDLEDS